jgi:hypothetical protein
MICSKVRGRCLLHRGCRVSSTYLQSSSPSACEERVAVVCSYRVVLRGLGLANLSLSLVDQLTKSLDNALQTHAVSEKDCAACMRSMMPQHDKPLPFTGHIHAYAQSKIGARLQCETLVKANTLSRRFQTQSALEHAFSDGVPPRTPVRAVMAERRPEHKLHHLSFQWQRI